MWKEVHFFISTIKSKPSERVGVYVRMFSHIQKNSQCMLQWRFTVLVAGEKYCLVDKLVVLLAFSNKTYIHIYIHTLVYTYIHTYTCTYVYMCMCVFYLFVYSFVCIYFVTTKTIPRHSIQSSLSACKYTRESVCGECVCLMCVNIFFLVGISIYHFRS